MIYGLYQSAAGMMANEYRQGVIANNLANADTVGFKRDVAVLAERLPARLAGERDGAGQELLDALSGGVWLGRTDTDFSQGTIQHTDNATDVALEGPGFLLVEQDGRQLATRDGRMIVDGLGRLVAATDGAPVLGVGGAPIRVNPRGGPIQISEFGAVEQDGRIVGRLGLIDFADYRALRKAGASRFAFEAATPAAPAARFIGRAVEGSGSSPIAEMVSMIEAARSYQLNASLLTAQDQSVGRLISTLGN